VPGARVYVITLRRVTRWNGLGSGESPESVGIRGFSPGLLVGAAVRAGRLVASALRIAAEA
jgi:hypothetical protein